MPCHPLKKPNKMPEQVTEQAGMRRALDRRDPTRMRAAPNCRPHLKLRDRRSFIDTYLKPALEAGLIEMTLPDKPTSRNQRYRRTSAGEALARQLTESGK